MRMMNRLKKWILLFGAAITISIAGIASVRAVGDGSDQSSVYLYYIMQNTQGILKKLDNFPKYAASLMTLALSWLTPDNSQSTAQLQANFAILGNLFAQSTSAQNKYTTTLNADLFHQPTTSFTQPADNPAILTVLPVSVLNINDLTYSTTLGLPPVPKVATPDSLYNYIKNAAGINIAHTIPAMNWQGTQEDQQKYLNYFATTMAIESFNGYVLSHELADGNTLSTAQAALIAQAGNSGWIAQIATEELGKVLRQILMFESQSYILLSELVQTQKQLLSAQIMTNSLLISNNQMSESLLVAKAQGVQPR